MTLQSFVGLTMSCIHGEGSCNPHSGTGSTGFILFVYGPGASRGEVAAALGTFLASTAGAGT